MRRFLVTFSTEVDAETSEDAIDVAMDLADMGIDSFDVEAIEIDSDGKAVTK